MYNLEMSYLRMKICSHLWLWFLSKLADVGKKIQIDSKFLLGFSIVSDATVSSSKWYHKRLLSIKFTSSLKFNPISDRQWRRKSALYLFHVHSLYDRSDGEFWKVQEVQRSATTDSLNFVVVDSIWGSCHNLNVNLRQVC